MLDLPLAQYTIAVDEKGLLADTVFEGALGFVARIKASDGSFRALKIPRLLADTDRENHYVCMLTRDEVVNAAKLVAKPGLTSLDFGSKSLLQSLSFSSGLQQVVIVQFSKELKPKFCLISADLTKKTLVFTPHLESLAWLTYEIWEAALKLSQGGRSTEPVETVVIRHRQKSAESLGYNSYFLLGNQQIGRDQSDAPDETWYLGLPSPVYFWREGTLEYAVRKGARKRMEKPEEWGWSDHCELCSQLATGLLSLYQEGFVHGDLRPANIMYGGWPGKPSDYLLVDYSSYSSLAGALSNPTPQPDKTPDQTLVGVAVAEARQSPFYPVERRVGRERENCDTVAIRQSNGMWIVHVGYRSEMLLGASNPQYASSKDTANSSEELSEEVKEQMDAVAREMQHSEVENVSAEWMKGDRVRVRDFVFQVDHWRSGPNGFTIIGKMAWLVHNNRILVPLKPDTFEGKDRVLSVSRTFPIWQWSMATDFYSLGVTLLYSLFFVLDIDKPGDSDTGDLDSDFEAMITVMSSVQYAGVILPNVATMAGLLQSIWGDEKFKDMSEFTPKIIAKLGVAEEAGEVKWSGKDAKDPFDINVMIKDDNLLLGRTWSIAMSVVQTTPGALRVLRACKYNLAIFVCLINIAMQLIHRKADLPKGKNRWKDWMCDDRTAPPSSEKVGLLLDDIKVTAVGLGQRFQNAVSEFVCPINHIVQYSSRNETLLSIALQGREAELSKVQTRLRGLEKRMQGAEAMLEEAKKILGERGFLFPRAEAEGWLIKLGGNGGTEDAGGE